LPNKARSSEAKQSKSEFTYAQALRDVLVASINKGQFPIAILGMVILTVLFRMPAERVGELAVELLRQLLAGWLLGYVLFGVTLMGWFVHAKKIRTEYLQQLNALQAEERKNPLGASTKSATKAPIRSGG